MQYDTVFDVSRQGLATYAFSAFGLVFVAIGALFVFRPALMRKLLPGGAQGRTRTVFSYVYFGFAMLWTFGSAAAAFHTHQDFSHALTQGRAHVVEGLVTDFRPAPPGGHGDEMFTVGDQRFAYSRYVVTGAFNREGIVHEGQRVRVTHLEGDILKLEIAREQPN